MPRSTSTAWSDGKGEVLNAGRQSAKPRLRPGAVCVTIAAFRRPESGSPSCFQVRAAEALRGAFFPGYSKGEDGIDVKISTLIILIWLAGVNLTAFLMMDMDKKRAKAKKRRIPEKTLFVTAILGGSIGAMLGMWTFRHKTKHRSFLYGMPVILLLQLLIVWVAVRGI